jgi:hypothetical protein
MHVPSLQANSVAGLHPPPQGPQSVAQLLQLSAVWHT